MNRPTRDTPAGRVYLDLQNRARRERRGTQELLTLYVVERWLTRLSRSSYVDNFVLKGGLLLAVFGQRRPTADADALARNMPRDQDAVAARVAKIAALTDPDDGVEFLVEMLSAGVIRDDARYSGIRLVMDARIATAIVKLRLDINFGDPVLPAPQMIELPALLPDGQAIRILGYPIETVLAEKNATAVDLGPANTRVRDYADIYTLTQSHRLAGPASAGTAQFREIELRLLSESVGNSVELRAATYVAYRKVSDQTARACPRSSGTWWRQLSLSQTHSSPNPFCLDLRRMATSDRKSLVCRCSDTTRGLMTARLGCFSSARGCRQWALECAAFGALKDTLRIPATQQA